MVKGKNGNEITRIVESENSTIIIIYHPNSRILFCSISDADDDVDKLIEVIKRIANRFWKKHQSDIKIFRTTSEKSRFQTIIADIENLTRGGTIAEVFPKLLVVKNVMKKILSMGMINESDFQVALKCTGESSPLKIARELSKTRNGVNEVLKRLEELDIIKM
jgi:Fe2+ transport system protein FeoA